MGCCRLGVVLTLAAFAGTVAMDDASARHLRRTRVAHHRVPHEFVFHSPNTASATDYAGKFAGTFVTGILGATTADPYEKPGYGYYVGGGQGPGYFYND